MQAQTRSRNPPIRPLEPFTGFSVEDVEQSIAQRFEEQVRAHGSRLAIQAEQGSLSFAQLNGTANALARAILVRRGVGAEPIALLFDHGAGVVASILGVLKTGKFYVVLDASHPAERLRYLLTDSGAGLMIADRGNLTLARQLAGDAVEIVEFAEHAESLSDANPEVATAPGELATIIYTSGSTGRPKGVMHTHRNMLADVRNVTNAWGVGPRDRWLWHTSIGFAGSARTIYGALLNGSTVYPFDSRQKGFAELADWLLRHEITIFRTIPTAFRSFVTTLPSRVVFPSVRILSMGGEPLFPSDVNAFNQHFPPQSVLVHPFGPTESMLVCWSVTPHGGAFAGHTVPIGYPLDDKTVLLLDEAGRQVKEGEIGEIAVKSCHLSPGYWRDPDRTNAVFLDDGGDERTYLTGDLGTRSGDGCLRHVGRRDFQLKIRGFRIETSEIETALRAMDAVRDAVVIGSPNDAGHSRLIAYFVPTTRPAVTVTELRKHLAHVLPDYMMPSIFVAMDALPQTPTGKTDRLRLPAAPGTRPEMSVVYSPPGTRLEEELVAIWAEALGLDRLGIHDDFFELGGDSLMAARVISRIKETLGADLPLTALFDCPTVAETARAISATGK